MLPLLLIYKVHGSNFLNKQNTISHTNLILLVVFDFFENCINNCSAFQSIYFSFPIYIHTRVNLYKTVVNFAVHKTIYFPFLLFWNLIFYKRIYLFGWVPALNLVFHLPPPPSPLPFPWTTCCLMRRSLEPTEVVLRFLWRCVLSVRTLFRSYICSCLGTAPSRKPFLLRPPRSFLWFSSWQSALETEMQPH